MNGTTATRRLLAKLDYFHRYLRDGSQRCLIAVRYLLPERPRWRALCCRACREAQTPSYCRSPPPRHTPTKMIPSRSWCSRAPCLVWSWSTSPTRIRPSRVPRSRSYRAMPQASSSPPRPMTKARPSLKSPLFQKATWTRQRFSTRTTLTAASPLAWQATAMSRFPLRVSRAAPLLPHPHVRSPMASRTFDSSRSTNGTSSTPTPRLWQCQRTKQQTTSPTRTLLPCRLICRRAGRQRCISIK